MSQRSAINAAGENVVLSEATKLADPARPDDGDGGINVKFRSTYLVGAGGPSCPVRPLRGALHGSSRGGVEEEGRGVRRIGAGVIC